MPRGHQHQGPCHPHKKALESVLQGGKGKVVGAWEQSWGKLSSCLCPTTRQRDLQAPLSEALAGALICQMKEASEEIASEGCVGWRG